MKNEAAALTSILSPISFYIKAIIIIIENDKYVTFYSYICEINSNKKHFYTTISK